jgi:hypothetical protein
VARSLPIERVLYRSWIPCLSLPQRNLKMGPLTGVPEILKINLEMTNALAMPGLRSSFADSKSARSYSMP